MDLDLSKLNMRPSRLINVIFVGHVDAGKSTICGRILVDLNRIDKRTLEKYREQSAEMNRASWFLSWCMDLNPEERERGKTTEVGTASFDLPHTRINILDAPGHKQFIGEMIDAAFQADVGILVVSARTSEFESGFQGGQTKEHLLLLKSSGVEHLIILVNKMDECNWSVERYEEIKQKVTKFIKHLFPEYHFVPISGTGGENIATQFKTDAYDGPSFLSYLDNLNIAEKKGGSAATIVEKVKTSGSITFYVKCDVESFSKNSSCLLLPTQRITRISSIITEDDLEAPKMLAGETYKVKLEAYSEEVAVGTKLVLPDSKDYCVSSEFFVHIVILEVNKAFTVGYCPIIHIGLQSVGCKVLEIISMDRKRLRVARKGERVIMRLKLDSPIVVSSGELKRDRFSLRDGELTVASGIVRKIIQ